ncbi:MAG: hypothetical protein SH817_14330 [Leptospira sp.]|nr:hypothetical protein [Leptospira sp.]
MENVAEQKLTKANYNLIKILFLEALIAFCLVFFDRGKLNLDYSFGAYDKLGWIKEFKDFIQKKMYVNDLLSQVSTTPGVVTEYWELGQFYLEKENNPEKAIQYFTKGFENDVTGNFPFQRKIFQAHIKMGYDIFSLSELLFSFWELEQVNYDEKWKEQYQRAANYYNIAIGMEPSTFTSYPYNADYFNFEGNLRLYEGDYLNAETAYKSCISFDNSREECFIGLAILKLRSTAENNDKRYQLDTEAFSLIQRSFELFEGQDKLLTKHALFEYWNQSPSSRKENLQRIKKLTYEMTKKKPGIGFYHYVLAQTYFDNWQEKEIHNMLRSYEIAFDNEPDSIQYCIDYGYNFALYKDSKKGIKILEECKSHFAPNYRMLTYLGDSYLLIGDYEKAKEIHLEAENKEEFQNQKEPSLSLSNVYSLGRANLALGHKEDGIKYLSLACNGGQGLAQACVKLKKETE